MGKKNKKEKAEEMIDECNCGDESCECGCSCGCNCTCGCESDRPQFVRRYFTKAERIAILEEYLTELKAEAAGVEEELAELRK
jgi:hypothetical protein